jgi:pilus assembly protein Flp/PilA
MFIGPVLSGTVPRSPPATLEGPVLRRFSRASVDFLRREDGPTAVEYAVMLALIIVVCIAAITTLGSNANSTFHDAAHAAAGEEP